MTLFWWTWIDAITIAAIGLAVLGVVLHAARSSTVALGDPGDSGWRKRAGSFRLLSAAGSVIALVGIVAFYIIRSTNPRSDPSPLQYAVPVIGSVLAVLILSRSSGAHRQSPPIGSVDLTPRVPWSFGARWWFGAWATVAAALMITVIAAGLASSRDSEGRFAFITMGFGAGQAGTSFPGWFYGLPVLIAVCVLVVVSALSLVRLARPALASKVVERELDVAFRRAQTRSVLQVGGGAMAFTIGVLWMFVGSASQLTASILSVNGELTVVVSPFAALHVPLTVTGLLLGGAGLGLILAPTWSPLFHRSTIAADAAMVADSKTAGS